MYVSKYMYTIYIIHVMCVCASVISVIYRIYMKSTEIIQNYGKNVQIFFTEFTKLIYRNLLANGEQTT